MYKIENPKSDVVKRLLNSRNVQLATLLETAREIENFRRLCQHDWGAVEYEPTVHRAYTIPADSHGSDYQGACHVPESVTNKWTRTCANCALTQETNRTKEVQSSGNGLRTTSQQPDFSNPTVANPVLLLPLEQLGQTAR